MTQIEQNYPEPTSDCMVRLLGIVKNAGGGVQRIISKESKNEERGTARAELWHTLVT